MKIVIKEWLKDKKATAMLLGWMFLSVSYTCLNAYVTILLGSAVATPDRLVQNLIWIGVVCLVQIGIEAGKSYLRPMSIHQCFSSAWNRFSDKIIDADVDLFTRYSCAHIHTLTEFIWKLSWGGQNLARAIVDATSVVSLLISIYAVGKSLIIPVAIIYAVGAIIARKLFTFYETIDKEANSIKKKRSQEHEDIINGFMEVRSFCTEEMHRRHIHDYNERIVVGRRKRAHINSLIGVSIEVIDTLGLFAVLIFTSSRILSGDITQAAAMSLIMLVFRIIEPILNIMNFVDDLSENLAMSKDFEKIINYINREPKSGSIEVTKFTDKIEFNNVSFAYETTGSALDGVSMTIKRGTKVGICGVSGGGKTTLFKLLNKFYSPSSGSILLDGHNIWDLTNKSYRSLIACVHQDNMIFPGTIRDNIAYGKPDAMEFEIVEAAKKANLYNFIMGLPDRFNTQVGPRGLKLSGGQKQRIALARLFLRNAEIVMLDEATSALDNESETFIQEAIAELKDKTVITIAHRLSTIKDCDIIYVMGDHTILESGTHEELMAKQGVYFNMQK